MFGTATYVKSVCCCYGVLPLTRRRYYAHERRVVASVIYRRRTGIIQDMKTRVVSRFIVSNITAVTMPPARPLGAMSSPSVPVRMVTRMFVAVVLASTNVMLCRQGGEACERVMAMGRHWRYWRA